ncbi:MAG TPA: MMPL family transporter [Candidatus Limnocylindria bacterium]|nr:MMPL family transporter [Candidatus Limnocylindria bacterium]
MNRRRWIWVFGALLLVVGLARLRFDADIFNLLPGDLPAVRGLQLQQQNFSNARELLVTVQADDAETASGAAQSIAAHLAAQTNLVRSARWQPPWLEQPADAAENLAWLWLQQPPAEFAALAARLAATNLTAELNAARETLATSLDPQELGRRSYDPFGFTQIPAASAGAAGFDTGSGIFASADGTYRIVFVEPRRDRMNYREAGEWFAAVRAEVARAVIPLSRSAPGLHVAYTGGPAFLSEISGGMESDLKSSVFTTVLVIAGLFWLAHRSWRPLGWLVVALLLTLALTLALGGLVFGTLNVVSLGFAAVLLGLTVDYGLVSYQEFVASPDKTPAEIRHEVAPGIGYSAATTAGTFLLLGLAGLPGLAQLGVLTALGLLVGAGVMLFFFLPMVARRRPTRGAVTAHEHGTKFPAKLFPTGLLVLAVIAVLVWRGAPQITASADPLRPRQSAAYAAMDRLKLRLGRTNEPMWAVFSGGDITTVARQLGSAQTVLAAAKARGEVSSFDLPAGFWPRPDYATTNLALAVALAARADEFRTAAESAGFTPDSLGLMRGMLTAWRQARVNAASPWPTNSTARWLVSQFAARDAAGGWLALGVIQPAGDSDHARTALAAALPAGVLLTSWESLGSALLGHVARRVTLLMGLIAIVLVGCLWLAFRHWREVALSFGALALSFSLLLAMMTLIGWSWNLLSLVALPLLLGSSVDSTIHVQLALRRHGPNLRALWGTTGKALLLCAGANIAGFGSLAWSSNMGLASLDLVCAVGVGCVFAVCVGLLPAWWQRLGGSPAAGLPPKRASSLYGARIWGAGLWLGRALPKPVGNGLARLIAAAYVFVRPARFAVVVNNLLPVLGDEAAARSAARRNFAEFARKLVDLWRYEAGGLAAEAVRAGEGWEHFAAAVSSGSGVLLVTPHLGNWEFGAPLLARSGVRPLVLTAPEPGGGLTEARVAARARQGIDTLVVGSDPFAFLEVIKRLQAGGVVALLVDRPPAPTRVEVEFFGRPFAASIAAAELARASGCVVLPVFILRDEQGHHADALPPLAYDRAALGDRAARIAFTGRLMRVFEPVIRAHPGQWFHFVPVWPEDDVPPVSAGP